MYFDNSLSTKRETYKVTWGLKITDVFIKNNQKIISTRFVLSYGITTPLSYNIQSVLPKLVVLDMGSRNAIQPCKSPLQKMKKVV